MKKLQILLLLAVLYPCLSQAQQYEYTYDNVGNRMLRQVVTLPSASKSLQAQNTEADSLQQNQFQSQTVYQETLNNIEVKIYPNPTQGKMKILISTNSEINNMYMELTTLNGKNILKRSEISKDFDIDITSEPSGIYLMQIQINNTISHWKIIKE